MKQYVCGFYFIDDNVVLIRKNKPEWQAGKLNGVGGAIEPEEYPIDAMRREFREEASKHTSADEWRFFALLRTNDCEIHFYSAYGSASGICSGTDEAIYFVEVDTVAHHPIVLPNLKWLIPLALSNEQPVVIIQ